MQSTIDPILYDLLEFRPRKGDLKKVEIIKASIECLATVGIEKTSYESIAKLIGTRRAHVAYHFSDKHDIYKSAIKFILATYQQKLIEKLEQASDGISMLEKYVEAGFAWAKENPKQVSVLLLLGYFCSIDEEYLELNHMVKTKGRERLYFILMDQVKKEMTSEKARSLSITIQNLTSSSIQDCYTTKNLTLETAQTNVLGLIKSLIDA
jgi:TetR/AcrR family transcriptional repressor of bet genes